MKADKRENVGIESLRIVAMLIIIAWHYGYYSGFSYDTYHPNVLWLNAICGGVSGNAIFIMITGFFLGNKPNVKIKFEKILKLLALASFYSLLFYVILGNHSFTGFTDALRCLRSVIFPYVYGDYWFIAGYVLVYLLSPFTNLLINSMNQDMFKKLIWIMGIVTVALPSLIGSTESFSNILEMFIFYYFIGAYISKYKVYEKISVHKVIWFFLGSVTIRVGLIYLYYHYASTIGFIDWNDLLRRMKNAYYVFNILIAATLLLLFAKIDIKNKITGTVIKTVSSTTLGVYLIHENSLVRPIWWETLKGVEFQNDSLLPLYCLMAVVVTFSVCMFIELFRKLVMNSISRLFNGFF